MCGNARIKQQPAVAASAYSLQGQGSCLQQLLQQSGLQLLQALAAPLEAAASGQLSQQQMQQFADDATQLPGGQLLLLKGASATFGTHAGKLRSFMRQASGLVVNRSRDYIQCVCPLSVTEDMLAM
jgi:hypothetical protein